MDGRRAEAARSARLALNGSSVSVFGRYVDVHGGSYESGSGRRPGSIEIFPIVVALRMRGSAATTLGVRDAQLRPRVDGRQRTLTLRLGLFDLDYLEFGLDVASAGDRQLAPAGRPRTTDRHGNCDG